MTINSKLSELIDTLNPAQQQIVLDFVNLLHLASPDRIIHSLEEGKTLQIENERLQAENEELQAANDLLRKRVDRQKPPFTQGMF